MSGSRCKALRRKFYKENDGPATGAHWEKGKLTLNSEWRQVKKGYLKQRGSKS